METHPGSSLWLELFGLPLVLFLVLVLFLLRSSVSGRLKSGRLNSGVLIFDPMLEVRF
jgi:hypothetical protein